MRLVLRLFVLLIFVSIASCDLTDPKKDKPKPEGYQEDIPWPSLANSPWPMFQHDPQNTGRSHHSVLNINFNISNELYSGILLAGCVVDFNTIYFNNSNPSKFYSYDKNSLEKNWEIDIGFESFTTPILAIDKIITSANNVVYALNFKGEILWTYPVSGKYIYQRSLNIDRDGNIFIVNNKELYKLSPLGQLIKKISDERINPSFNTTSFSPDGSTLYVQGNLVSLLAFDSKTLELKWTFGNQETSFAPIVDSNGNIYIFPAGNESEYKLQCINSEGMLKWEFAHREAMYAACEPAIGKYGDIYFGLDTLYSVSFKGKLNWKRDIIGGELPRSNISSITTDLSNNIIVGTFDNHVLIISRSNELMNDIKCASIGNGFLPVIISNTELIAPAYDGSEIFILK